MTITAAHTPKAIFHLVAASPSIPKLFLASAPRLSVVVFSTSLLVVVSETTSVNEEVWEVWDVGEVVASDDRLMKKTNEINTNFLDVRLLLIPLRE